MTDKQKIATLVAALNAIGNADTVQQARGLANNSVDVVTGKRPASFLPAAVAALI